MRLQSITILPSEINFEYHKNIQITYQLFGKPLNTAPIILVNHALTGNSSVAGASGWWNKLIGEGLTIDTKQYSIIAFDIPGNGYDGKQENLHTDYKLFSTYLIAKLYWSTLNKLGVFKLQALIGGSLGGSIGWEMIVQEPNRINIFIPIACNYKASDWLIGNVFVQDSILNHSLNPIENARMHAMLLYRTPESFKEKFENQYNKETQSYEVENWLNCHGKALKKRFKLESYKLMNHLLKTTGQQITSNNFNQFLKNTNTRILMISVNSDYMFTEKEQFETYQLIKKNYANVNYSVIESVHGHDAFLIEYKQLNKILQPFF